MAKEYYKNKKENLQEVARSWYKNLSEDERNKEENMEEIDLEIYPRKIKKLQEHGKHYR